MYVEIYPDIIFLINFVMDFLLLFVIKKVLKSPGAKWRLLLGAGIGAMGACILAIFPNLYGFLQFIVSYILIAGIMIWASFPLMNWQSRIKAIIMLYITTFFLGGFVNALYYNTRLGYYFLELMQGRLLSPRNISFFILAGISGLTALYIFVKTLKNLRSKDNSLYETDLVYGDKSIKLMGLLDTGNDLYDPFFGKPVIIIEITALVPLLTNSQYKQLLNLFNTIEGKTNPIHPITTTDESVHREEEPLAVMMIPYHSIGKRNGILPAIIMNQIVVNKGTEKTMNEKVYTAVSKEYLSANRKYQLILHKDML